MVVDPLLAGRRRPPGRLDRSRSVLVALGGRLGLGLPADLDQSVLDPDRRLRGARSATRPAADRRPRPSRTAPSPAAGRRTRAATPDPAGEPAPRASGPGRPTPSASGWSGAAGSEEQADLVRIERAEVDMGRDPRGQPGPGREPEATSQDGLADDQDRRESVGLADPSGEDANLVEGRRVEVLSVVDRERPALAVGRAFGQEVEQVEPAERSPVRPEPRARSADKSPRPRAGRRLDDDQRLPGARSASRPRPEVDLPTPGSPVSEDRPATREQGGRIAARPSRREGKRSGSGDGPAPVLPTNSKASSRSIAARLRFAGPRRSSGHRPLAGPSFGATIGAGVAGLEPVGPLGRPRTAGRGRTIR